jgi:HSP20 family protein
MAMNEDTSVKSGIAEPVAGMAGREEEYILPLADILETPEAYVVVLDMPGAQKENMRVRLERGSLVVTAPTVGHSHENGTILHEETRTPGYVRSFSLGEGIDLKHVDAQFQDGVLTIKLFKNEELQPREISIR